jgi:hypothetical protein
MWLALLLLIGGYLVGQWVNRQRTKRAGAWIQAGLGALGGRVAWRWSKTLNAGAEVTVEESRAPYRNLVISYYLLTREFPPLWLWERLRGKRDLVSVRANLRLLPTRQFEILPLQGALKKKLDQMTSPGSESAQGDEAPQAPARPYEWVELSHDLGLGMAGSVDANTRQKARDFINVYGPYIERVSLRRRNPHVIAFFRLGALQNRSSADLWQALGELVRG